MIFNQTLCGKLFEMNEQKKSSIDTNNCGAKRGFVT